MSENKPFKVLNLYAGIGGNRKLWTDCEVTAVELNESIAAIYKDLYPNDIVIVADAHQFLLQHYKEYDFIWGSPPCPSHSLLRMMGVKNGQYNLTYPDMKLYQEIIILNHYCETTFCIENVRSYYPPLIAPQISGRHYFWSNFKIKKLPHVKTHEIKNKPGEIAMIRMYKANYPIEDWHNYKGDKRQLFSNLCNSEIGLHILNQAKGITEYNKSKQAQLF